MANEELKERNIENALEAAYQLFLRNGIANTTKEMLARSSGLSRSSVDRYFPNKTVWVLEVTKWAGNTIKNRCDPAQSITDDTSLSGAAMLRKYMEGVCDLMRKNPDIFTLGVECRVFIYRNSPKNSQEQALLYESLGSHEILKQVFERGIADGSFSNKIDPETESAIMRESLLSFLAGIVLSYNAAFIEDKSLTDNYIDAAIERYKL